MIFHKLNRRRWRGDILDSNAKKPTGPEGSNPPPPSGGTPVDVRQGKTERFYIKLTKNLLWHSLKQLKQEKNMKKEKENKKGVPKTRWKTGRLANPAARGRRRRKLDRIGGRANKKQTKKQASKQAGKQKINGKSKQLLHKPILRKTTLEKIGTEWSHRTT